MVKEEVACGPGGRVVIMDSITKVTPDDEGSFVVAASHGGTSSGEFALAVPLRGVFFNDAGLGKDGAGIASLGLLQGLGIPAGTVSHTSARIGDAPDLWESGFISHLNEAARGLGIEIGASLKDSLEKILSTRPSDGEH